MKTSKHKLYAINWLYSNGSSAEKIADELDLKIETVKEHIERSGLQHKSKIATKSQPVKSSKDLMIRHTKEKKTNNVSIMTREASAFNDDAKKKLTDKQNKNQNYIFKPNK